MKLSDLEPKFIRYETRAGVEYVIPVAALADAQGIQFLCPVCFAKNAGPVGTHGVAVTFHDRGALDSHGSHNREGQPSRWAVSGAGFGDITLQPSIDITLPACSWHGFITNGEVT